MAEQHVVPQRDAQRRPGTTRAAASVPGRVDRLVEKRPATSTAIFGTTASNTEHGERPQPSLDEVAAHCATPTAPAKPRGPASRTTPSSSTTARSPMPGRRVVVRVLLVSPTTTAATAEPRDRAEPADDDDDEREDQQRRPAPGRSSRSRRREHAGERSGDAAEREDERERLADVDAERRHHCAVLDARADDQPVAGVPQEGEQRRADDDRARDLDQRSFGMCAPNTVVVSWSHRGT